MPFASIEQLQAPMTLSVAHPLSGEPVEVTLTRDLFVQLIFNLLYSTDFVSLLPLLIHHVHETGDFAPLVAQAMVVSESTGLYHGMLYAVTCSEDAPFIDLEEAEALRSEIYFPLMAEQFLQICGPWPRGETAADFREPVVSNVPVLLLSGGADPVTPPAYAEQVAEALTNKAHLIVPGYGHGVIGVGCIPDLVTEFIRQGTEEGLDISCLERIQPPPFFVDFTGPEP